MRFEAFNIFRFITVIIIILFHLNFSPNINYKNIAFHIPLIFFDGPDIVTFFFVLSGFVMTISYYERGNSLLLDRNYWLNRISRIYPVYLLALLLTIIAFGISQFDFALILNLFLLQAWFPQYVMAYNGPAWFLSVEVFFYAIFPIILYYIKKQNYNPYHMIFISLFLWLITQITLVILINSSLYEGVAGSFWHEFIYHSPLPHLCSFLIGMAGGYFIIKKQDFLNLPKYISYGFFILIILGGPYIIGHQGVFRQLTGLSIPFAASFFSPLFLLLILSIVMINNTFLAKILSNRLFLILGASSYALYILQQPMHKLLYQSIFPFSGISEEKKLLIFLNLEIILSIIAFYTIEIPGKMILKNLFQEKTRTKSWWKFWE